MIALSKSPVREPKLVAAATSRPATAEVANAARVRWDLAIPTG